MKPGLWVILSASVALSACSRPVPDDTGAGVGFGDYASYQLQQNQARSTSTALPPIASSGTETVIPPRSASAGNSDIAGIAASAIAAAEAPATPPTAPTVPQETAAVAPPSSPSISDEQDFDAVAARETIETDAERLARMAAQRVEVAPTAVPDRPGSTGPNIVEYALSTTHPVGQQVYRRSALRAGRHEANCLSYQSADLAQQAFLSMGGPERDRQVLDPDGDGYACSWDPNIYRTAARSG